MRQTLQQSLLHAAEHGTGQVSFYDFNASRRNYSYAELAERAQRVAGHLRAALWVAVQRIDDVFSAYGRDLPRDLFRRALSGGAKDGFLGQIDLTADIG